MKIDDATAYRWKMIQRVSEVQRGHLYVEPSERHPGVMCGSIEFRTPSDVRLIDAGPNQFVGIRVGPHNSLDLRTAFSDWRGNLLFEMSEGHTVRHRDDRVTMVQRAGSFRLTGQVSDDLVPAWAIEQVRYYETFAADGELVLLSVEVVRPNLVRIEGCWVNHQGGLMVTPNSFSVVEVGRENALCLRGDPARESSVVNLNMPSGSTWWSAIQQVNMA